MWDHCVIVMRSTAWHKRHTWIKTSVNVSGWIHSIDTCCIEWSSTSGWISAGERSWYGGKGWCKWCHIIDVNHSYITHEYICMWLHQHKYTPLMYAAGNGYLPMVEYLVERGADMEAKNIVSDVISLMWNHTHLTYAHECICVNVSEWKHSIDVGCMERSFTSGWIFGGERSWYGSKGWC